MNAQLTYSYSSLASILPKKISDQIIFVYTNSLSSLDMSFEHSSINAFFGFDEMHEIPFITIDNPFAFLKKIQEEIQKKERNSKMD